MIKKTLLILLIATLFSSALAEEIEPRYLGPECNTEICRLQQMEKLQLQELKLLDKTLKEFPKMWIAIGRKQELLLEIEETRKSMRKLNN